MEKYRVDQQNAALYSKGYSVFLKRTNFRERIAAAVTEYLGSHAEQFSSRPEPIRLLEVGCGNGEMTVHYLRALRRALPNVKIQIDLVEPAQGALSEAVQTISNFDSGIQVRAFPETMDSFAAKQEFQSSAYDWMIASYVFYHVSPTIVPALLSRLSPQGLFMAAMGSPQHPLREPTILRSLSKHGDSNLILDVLEQQNVRSQYSSEVETVSTEVNLNGLWNQQTGPTDDGTSFFSFIYNHDLAQFTAEERSALNNLLASVFRSQDGRVYPAHNIFWVRRK